MRPPACVPLLVATVVSACVHPAAHVQSSTMAPATTNAASVIVSVGDVGRIAGFTDLSPYQSRDDSHPSHFPHDEVPQPCQPAYQQDVAFGTGWTQFRSAVYVGETNTAPGQARAMVDIIQGAAIYPDPTAARAAFDRTASSLTTCENLHTEGYEFTLDKKDNSTLVVDTGRFGIAFRVKSAVLVEVSVVGLTEYRQVASDVTQAMSARVN